VNIHGDNYELNINRTHNAQSGIYIGNDTNHPREMSIYMCNNVSLNKFCWLSTIHKWKKAQETDNLIAVMGTIYGTSMFTGTAMDSYREVIC
jgi:hypothetical protein